MRRFLLLVVLLCLLALNARSQTTYSIDAFAGIANFDSTQTVGGVKLIDQGGDATLGGVRTGVGHRWPAGLYLGVELEGLLANGRSRAVVNGEVYDRDLQGAVGGFARVGWMTHSGALFYGRAGAQQQFGPNTMALGIGVGAEVPFSPRWFARADMLYLTGGGVETVQATAGIGIRLQ